MPLGNTWPPLEPLGMAGSAVLDLIYPVSVLLSREEETGKVCLCEDIIGVSCGVVGLLSNE